MNIRAISILITCISLSLGTPVKELNRKNVTPEELDQLLKEKKYEEFAKILGIPSVDLVRPSDESRSKNPMFNKGLKFGDMIYLEEEEDRTMLNFDRFPNRRWPNRVPYAISNDYTADQKRTIENAINAWNNNVGDCVRLVPRSNENDYLNIFSGGGCWSYVGKIGGAQGLSLNKDGCVWHGTTLHEIGHGVVGFGHQQNRNDRDNFVEILWDNIPDEWKSQYNKDNPPDMILRGAYDYNSVMHYGYWAPGGKVAYRLKYEGIEPKYIGQGWGLTEMDKRKIREQYGCSQQ